MLNLSSINCESNPADFDQALLTVVLFGLCLSSFRVLSRQSTWRESVTNEESAISFLEP